MNQVGSSGFLGTGFRLAEMAGDAVMIGRNVASDLAEATVQRQREQTSEEELAEKAPSATNQMPMRRERSRSRDDSDYEQDDDLGEREGQVGVGVIQEIGDTQKKSKYH